MISVALILNFPGRKTRHLFTMNETSLLMSEFRKSPYATQEVKTHLSKKLGIETYEIRVWFDRRRCLLRKLEPHVTWKGTCN